MLGLFLTTTRRPGQSTKNSRLGIQSASITA